MISGGEKGGRKLKAMEEAVSHVEGLMLAGRIVEAANESRALLLYGLHGEDGSPCPATDGLLIRLLYVMLQSYFICGRWDLCRSFVLIVEPLFSLKLE